jgi:hypothetical protein
MCGFCTPMRRKMNSKKKVTPLVLVILQPRRMTTGSNAHGVIIICMTFMVNLDIQNTNRRRCKRNVVQLLQRNATVVMIQSRVLMNSGKAEGITCG